MVLVIRPKSTNMVTLKLNARYYLKAKAFITRILNFADLILRR